MKIKRRRKERKTKKIIFNLVSFFFNTHINTFTMDVILNNVQVSDRVRKNKITEI